MDSTEKNVKIRRRAAEIFRFLLSGGIATLLDYAKRHPKAVRPINPAYTIIWSE